VAEAPPPSPEEVLPPPVPPRPAARLWRIGLVAALLVALWVTGKLTGIADHLSVEWIRATTAEAGPWGWAAYIGVFTGGLMIAIPGLVFHAAAILAYGRITGAILAYVGAVVAVTVKFVVVRAIGGQSLQAIRRPWVQRLLGRLDRHPILIVGALRVIFFTGPWLNYVFALSPIRFRDHFIGSVLGMIIPILVMTTFFDWLFR